jgi:hypothetical protein
MSGNDPTLFLAVAGPTGAPLDAPYFAALTVARSTVSRLRQLARLCQSERIAWLATRDCEPPVYWHVADEVMTEQTSTYHVIGTCIYVELSARRRVAGGYGPLEVIGQTPAFDLAELVHMRTQQIVFDFRENDGQAGEDDEPFALGVFRRLRSLGVWPQLTH